MTPEQAIAKYKSRDIPESRGDYLKPCGYYKPDGGAVMVCGGEHEFTDGLDSLFYQRVKHNSDGVACGLPRYIEVYFVGTYGNAPVRAEPYLYEYDEYKDFVDITLTPTYAFFGDEYTMISYTVSET